MHHLFVSNLSFPIDVVDDRDDDGGDDGNDDNDVSDDYNNHDGDDHDDIIYLLPLASLLFAHPVSIVNTV